MDLGGPLNPSRFERGRGSAPGVKKTAAELTGHLRERGFSWGVSIIDDRVGTFGWHHKIGKDLSAAPEFAAVRPRYLIDLSRRMSVARRQPGCRPTLAPPWRFQKPVPEYRASREADDIPTGPLPTLEVECAPTVDPSLPQISLHDLDAHPERGSGGSIDTSPVELFGGSLRGRT